MRNESEMVFSELKLLSQKWNGLINDEMVKTTTKTEKTEMVKPKVKCLNQKQIGQVNIEVV